MTIEDIQRAVCKRHGSVFSPSPDYLKLGISLEVRSGVMPLKGMRHPPEEGATGWFIWAGETLSSDDDFFVPLHIKHIDEWSSLVRPYLGLSQGWRFLVTTTQADVWFDGELLKI